MMIDTVIEILKESGAEAWEIHDTHTDGLEFYFIRHELDQNRAKKVEHLNVTVYVRVKEGTYGIATGEIYPTCTEQEIRETVEGLCENARYAENRAYRLNQKKPVQTENVSFDVYANARAFIDTLQSVHETYTEFINSYEVFTGVSTDRFLNSEGVDVTETYPESMAEVIINARNAEHEIELYRMYRSGTCDAESMKKDIEKTMQYGRDRLQATNTPDHLDVPVLLSGSDAVRVYHYLVSRLDTGYIYQGLSSAEIGDNLIPERNGDPLNIHALRTLQNSSMNHVIDPEGAVICDMPLIENNTVKACHGSRRFSEYLGMNDTFQLTNWAADGGSISEDEIRKGDYLEVVEFSGFEVSETTGDIFGEIRLGYLHQGDRVTVVKGGSVSGNIQLQLKDMLFSDVVTQYNNVRIPSLTRLAHVTIAGCEKR